MRQITVSLPSNQYLVMLGHGLVLSPPEQFRDFIEGRKVAVIIDACLPSPVAEKIKTKINDCAKLLLVRTIQSGDKSKNMETVLNLAMALSEASFDRSDRVVAIGGGSISDLAGLMAALYMRGIPYMSIPTTTLSQCDACLGGKVAVNFAGAKNLLGTFYHPSLVLVDPQLAETLDPIHRKTGLVEAIKAGIIGDPELFSMIEASLEQITAWTNGDLIDEVIYRALEVKAGIIMHDERESGLRMKLNLGHTIGHAIEMLMGPSSISHGEAVAIGLIAAATIAVDRGLLATGPYKRIINLMKHFILSEDWKHLDSHQILERTTLDKKRRDGRLHFVLPTGIGSVIIAKDIHNKEITQCLEKLKYNDL